MKEFGVLVPIVTPCTKKGEIDYAGLTSVYKDMINAGCNGIFVAGSTGRGPWFCRDDRVKICKTIAGYRKDGIPLFAGCIGTGLKEMLENARAMADAGADIAVITAPGYFNYNQKEVEYIFSKFADESTLPVLIYDIPDFAGMKLDMKMLMRLSQHKNIIGFKDSSADFNRFKDLIDAMKGLPELYLLQGKEHLLSDALMAGASGIVVSLIHIDPIPFVNLYRAVRAGDFETARYLQKEIIIVMGLVVESFKIRPEISTLFHFLNCSLKERDVCDNILMEHEDDCPDWLEEKALKAVDILKKARVIKNFNRNLA